LLSVVVGQSPGFVNYVFQVETKAFTRDILEDRGT